MKHICGILWMFFLMFVPMCAQGNDWVEQNFSELRRLSDLSHIDKKKDYWLIASDGEKAYVLNDKLKSNKFVVTPLTKGDFSLDNSLYHFHFVPKGKDYYLQGNNSSYYYIHDTGSTNIKRVSSGQKTLWSMKPSEQGVYIVPPKDPTRTLVVKESAKLAGAYGSTNGYLIVYIYERNSGVNEISIATKEGYGTVYSERPYVMPEGIVGYTITDANPGTGDLTLNPVFHGGDVVPAQTALLVQGSQGKHPVEAPKEGTKVLAENHAAALSKVEGNLLMGTAKAATTVAPSTAQPGEAYYFYKMYYLTDTETGTKKLGFFWGAEGGQAFTNGANKAYLALKQVQAANIRGFVLPGKDVTGIVSPVYVPNTSGMEGIYTLEGIKLNETSPSKLPAGIYLINGKKTLIK